MPLLGIAFLSFFLSLGLLLASGMAPLSAFGIAYIVTQITVLLGATAIYALMIFEAWSEERRSIGLSQRWLK